MILKSYIIEQNTSTLEKYKSVLFYGENTGLKDELKEKIKELNQKAENINFFQDEIIKNKDLLGNEIVNTSLFNDQKIIFLNKINDKAFDIISKNLDDNSNNIKIYIFCDLLEKKSKLRNYFEKEINFGIVPCYQDNQRTLYNYLNQNLKGYSGVTPEIINFIIKNSHEDRKIISSEIIKIKQFFLDKKIIRDDLLELLNIKQNTNFSLLRDAALLGNKSIVNKLLSEVDFVNESSFFYLNQMSSRIARLLEIKSSDTKTNDSELSMELLKPKIFWKDKPVYNKQLQKWDATGLNRVLEDMLKLEKLMKSNSHIRNDLLIKNFLIGLCGQAATS